MNEKEAVARAVLRLDRWWDRFDAIPQDEYDKRASMYVNLNSAAHMLIEAQRQYIEALEVELAQIKAAQP